MGQDQNGKKKPKVSIRKYSKDLTYTSETLLEKNLESITKVLIPFLFVLMFIPGLALIGSAFFLANYFVFLMTSEEWKDEFKDAAKTTVSVKEAEFEGKKEALKRQSEKEKEKTFEDFKSDSSEALESKDKEIHNINSQNSELQNKLENLQRKQAQLEASLASIVVSGNEQEQEQNSPEQSL
jgi:Ca2+/Na+ antiporter